MAGRYGDLEYGRLTKTGVIGGAGLFVVGALAEYGLQAAGSTAPTLNSVFLGMEFLGPALALLSMVLFGVALPLTE